SSARANCRPVSLRHHGRFDKALRSLAQRRQTDLCGDIMRAFVLAELDDGPRLALEEYRKVRNPELLRESVFGGWTDVLLLLGKKEEAVKTRLKYPEPLLAQMQDRTEFAEVESQFARGLLTEKEYQAKAGASRIKQAYTNYNIALLRLATGDREGAR